MIEGENWNPIHQVSRTDGSETILRPKNLEADGMV